MFFYYEFIKYTANLDQISLLRFELKNNMVKTSY